MKRLRNLWILILLFGLVSMSACGKLEEARKENLEATVNCAETVAAHQNLLLKHSNLEAECKRQKEREAEYVTAIQTLSDENLALRTALALTQALGKSRQEELETALNELIILREEKKEWGRFAQKEYEQLLKNYNKLDALFPPTHFSSDKELIKWRANTGNVTELGCLGLQRLALADGYIISVHPGLGYCVAIAGNYWYRITPGDQDLVEKIRKVE